MAEREFRILILQGLCLAIQMIGDLKAHDFHKGLKSWADRCDSYIQGMNSGEEVRS